MSLTRRKWEPVSPCDEYAEIGDNSICETPSWIYYYNATRKVLRRYGVLKNEGRYQEINYRHRPDGGAVGLAQRLSTLFSGKRHYFLIDEQL